MATASHLRLQILGPLQLWRDGVELDAGPRQQAYLLALLLARVGEPMSTGELIDLIWANEFPVSALNTIHKYVGALRRLLEPELPEREAGSYLHRRGNSYVLTAGSGTLDLAAFREHVSRAKAAVADQQQEAALDHYLEALRLWRGPAGEGLEHGSAALSIFAALDTEFLAACTAAADLACSQHRPNPVLPSLYLAASMAPLDESVYTRLILTLATAGRQAEALSAFSEVRARLAGELGVDPGPRLRSAQRLVLARSSEPTVLVAQEKPSTETTAIAESPAGLVGRAAELTILRRGMTRALAGGRMFGIVDGEPGVGKTRLLEEAAAEVDQRGAFVVWGSCLPGDGIPTMWPWEQVISTILNNLPTPARNKWLAGELSRLVEPTGDTPAGPPLPDGATQFRLFEQVVALINDVSADHPTLIIMDDLQWADTTSLLLFTHLATRQPPHTAIIGALRDSAPPPGTELSRLLATTSRLPHHHRLHLNPLTPHETAQLIHHETGHHPTTETAHTIHTRTAGNPFFIRELALHHTTETGVPATVRDIVLERMTTLDHHTRTLLQTAALIGRDINITVLAHVTQTTIETCLEHLNTLTGLGLLRPERDNPFSCRFTHDLVRETVTEIVAMSQAPGIHLRIADALQQTGTDDDPLIAERLAYHLRAAGPLADPARTASALIRAGLRASTKSAFDAAVKHLGSAAEIARAAGHAELELSALTELTTVIRRHSVYRSSTFELMERAEQVARHLGREAEATDFLFSQLIGTATTARADRDRLARRLRDQGRTSADPVVRRYGLRAWGLLQWDLGNIAAAYQSMTADDPATASDTPPPEESLLRRDLRLSWASWQAVLTALHGDLDLARVLLERLAAAAGHDHHTIAAVAHYATMTAEMAGDPAWALRAVRRWEAADPGHFFRHVDHYLRQSRCWALALTGHDPAGAASEAEQVLAATMLDPPRWGIAFHYGLIAEMHLAADMPDQAETALDQADRALDAYKQRYAEGLLQLLRAQLLQARGEPFAVVKAAAEKARALSADRGAYLFVRRAERFLVRLAPEQDKILSTERDARAIN